MAAVSSAYVITNPSYMMPETIMQYNQKSGAMALVATGNPMVRLGTGDLYVYAKTLQLRTRVASGQVAYNQLPSVSLVTGLISTSTYLTRVRAEYDHHDTAAMANWGISLPEAQRLGMRQGIFGQARNGLLYGHIPSNGEGLLNTAGATAVTLPADSNGNDTVLTYDNGQMATFLLAQVLAAKQRMNQLGQPSRVVVTGPQRTLGVFEYQAIVQLTQFQREGAGSVTTAGMLKTVLDMNADELEWTYDDTLQGKGAGGTDAVVISIPEIRVPVGRNADTINTSIFSTLTPGLMATSVQLTDMAAPREIPAPLPGGAVDVLAEQRFTSGWGLRPEGLTIVSMQYQ